GWTYGTNLAYLRELVAYWRERFDWRAAEARLNALPQFRARVGGLGIHFIHVRGVGPAPLPLVITHGWPGSVAEFVEIIGPLTDPARHGGDPADAFDVVAPSMPGYGFSDHPAVPGMEPERIAALWAELMRGLDRREVPHLERLRRGRRAPLHEGPAAHERDALLGAGDRELLLPALLRGDPCRPLPAHGRPGRRPDRVRDLPEGADQAAANM